MTRTTLSVCAALLMFSLSALAEQPCTLPDPVLAPYRANSTLADYKNAIVTMEDFMALCGSRQLSGPTRMLFFQVVSQEFAPGRDEVIDHLLAGTSSEGPYEMVNQYQRHLRDFMDTIVTSNDKGYSDVILAYGGGKAIAALGPSIKKQVHAALAPPVTFFGYHGPYSTQLDALNAIGQWIDPSETRFSPKDKAFFAKILTEGMNVSPGAFSSNTQRQLFTTLDALGHSDDPDVEQKVRDWAAKRDAADGNKNHALKVAEKIHGKAQKNKKP